MAPLQHSSAELRFVPVYTEVGSQFYTANGEWELSGSRVMTFDKDVEIEFLPIVKVTFYFKRRPAFILVNIILPVVLLMFLNILVFLIPVESGEKISYGIYIPKGTMRLSFFTTARQMVFSLLRLVLEEITVRKGSGITVQLALALFLSVVSEMLPNVSDTIPILMMYLYTINFLSVLTVIASIAVVFLHNIETDSKDGADKTTNTSNKLTAVKGTRSSRNSVTPVGLADCLMEDMRNNDSLSRMSNSSLNSSEALSTRSNQRKQFCQWFKCSSRSRCINLVSLYVFLFVWCGLTASFLLQASRSVKIK